MLICVDFDGVLHSYTSGWQGIDRIPDPPVEGAFEWLETLLAAKMQVAISSSRSRSPIGIQAMEQWFRDYGFNPARLLFPAEKPPAFLTIDDRAMTFKGCFPTIAAIRSFKTWQEK